MKILTAFLAGVILASGAVVAARGANSQNTPYCPSEDSCTVDYRDGRWTVSEVTP